MDLNREQGALATNFAKGKTKYPVDILVGREPQGSKSTLSILEKPSRYNLFLFLSVAGVDLNREQGAIATHFAKGKTKYPVDILVGREPQGSKSTE